MKNKNLILLILFFYLINPLTSFGQVKFDASVQRNEVSAGERFQVQFTLQNTQGRDFKAPNFKGFSVLSGPSQSQSTQWINGKVSSSISFVYLLQADNPGKYTIESASITADGKRLSSNPLSITVTKGAPKSAPNDDEKNFSKQADDYLRKNIFIRLNVSKQTAYEGEALIATYKLYVHPQLNVMNLSQPKMPSFNGFWTQDIENKQIKFNREVLDGVAYNVAELKKVVLLPQQSGNLTIEPMDIEANVRIQVQQKKQRRNMFDDFFDDPFFNQSYKDINYNVKSKSTVVNIKQLPDGAPVTFHGAVGGLQMKAWLDKTTCKTNDAVTMKIQISGTGNLKLIEPIPLNMPPDIDSYEPKTNESITTSVNGMTGSKTFEYYLIPRNAGEYKIDAVKFTYFDLNQKKYVTLTSNDFTLKVEKGAGNAGNIVSGLKKEDVKLIGRDLQYIKTGDIKFSKSANGFYGSVLFFISLVSPFMFFVLAFVYKRRQDKLSGDKALMRNKKANSVARKRLANVKKLMDENNEIKFYEEISKVLWGYISDKLVIPISELNKENAKIAFENKNLPADFIENIFNTTDKCEYARFAPVSEKISLSELYNQAASLITNLEGYLK